MTKIVLLTSASQAYSCLADVTEPNKQEYCTRWGLKYKRVSQEAVYHGWQRPRLWLDTLMTCDWMFWIGADAMITNMKTSPQKFTRGKHDFVFTTDIHGLQDDVFWLRKTPATIRMLKWASANVMSYMNEQYALAAYLQTHDKQVVPKIVPPRDLQAYPNTLFYNPKSKYCASLATTFWIPGAFSLHLPGLPINERLKLFAIFLSKVTR
jgi:hypothetical protein